LTGVCRSSWKNWEENNPPEAKKRSFLWERFSVSMPKDPHEYHAGMHIKI
jgi:hypothetical protein